MFEQFSDAAHEVILGAHHAIEQLQHPHIGTEHLLLGLTVAGDETASLLHASGVTAEALQRLIGDLLGFGPGVPEPPPLSPDADRVLAYAADEAARTGSGQVEPAHILIAVTRDRDTVAAQLLRHFGLDPSVLHHAARTGGGRQIHLPGLDVPSGQRTRRRAGRTRSAGTGQDGGMLERFGRNLNDLAASGRLDPLVGRASELRRLQRVLVRRTKRNPVLVGDAGVGKTALVEGLASAIAAGTVPAALCGRQVYQVDLGGLVAGTRHRGDFEERLTELLADATTRGDVILFIDEIHTVAGAGASDGSVDASGILKPALARGELQLIGATTPGEYRRHIERDTALERRFHPVRVDEPDLDGTVAILEGVRGVYATHHNATFSDEALRAAAELSVRYLPDRRLPDKALDLLDETASRLRLEGDPSDDGTVRVGRDDIAGTLTELTGVPAAALSSDDAARLLSLPETLSARVVGQGAAVDVVARALRRSRAGVGDPDRPWGSLLFLGPSGVGKTELAKALAAHLFDDDSHMVRLDMSEFMEAHTVSRLVGAPPGYVGHGEGGQLTETVRRNPHCVVLLDEIEKAHPDVLNTLLQVLDDGRLTDAEGRTVDFRSSVVIMTSNLGTSVAGAAPIGFTAGSGPDPAVQLADAAHKALRGRFPAELVNRIDDTVVFAPLGHDDLCRIVDLLTERLRSQVAARSLHLTLTDDVRRWLAAHGSDPQMGARPLRRAVQRHLEDAVADVLLARHPASGSTLHFTVAPSGHGLHLTVDGPVPAGAGPSPGIR